MPVAEDTSGVGNMNAAERLAAWLDRAGQTQRDFADSIESSEGQVSNLLSGRRTPSLALASRIEELTGIPASSWVATSQSDGAVA